MFNYAIPLLLGLTLSFNNATAQDVAIYKKMPDSYSVVFSKETIDLSQITTDKPQTYTVNAIFGTAYVVFNPEIPTRINVNPSFWADVLLPDGTKVSSSSREAVVYQTKTSEKPLVIINLNATCGSITLQNK